MLKNLSNALFFIAFFFLYFLFQKKRAFIWEFVGFPLNVIVGSLPNFLAGVTVPFLFYLIFNIFFQLKKNTVKVICIFTCFWLILEEKVSIFAASHFFDMYDIIFSIIGVSIAYYLLSKMNHA